MDFSPTIIAKLRERAERHEELGRQLADPLVAGDHKRYTELLREQGQLEESARLTRELDDLLNREQEAEAMLADGSEEPEMTELAAMELEEIEEQQQALDLAIKSALVSDAENERDKAIVEIRAGTGGDEATLFCADLFRMYQRYCETMRWKVEVMNQKNSEVGGLKEIVLGVKGASAYRLLRFEAGGHRVQRVPQTESQGRIHTSAATVAVLPEADEVELDIKTEDLRIDTMRASGAGGQHVNKTESAVRIVHIPTGVMVVCMDEKSQHKNRAQAMRILRSRLFELERRRIHDERAENRRSQVGSGDRSERIRTYNFPQNRCTDHRINQNFSLEHVMTGKLQPTIDALEEWDRDIRIQEL